MYKTTGLYSSKVSKNINVKLDNYFTVIYKNVVLGDNLKYLGMVVISATYSQMLQQKERGGGKQVGQNVSW